MRICQIVPSLEARHGGPSRSVRQLSRALADAGQAVDLLTTALRPDPDSTAGGLSVRYFRRVFPTAISRAPALARLLATQPYDIVHHHALWLRTLHYAAQTVRHQPVAPLVISPRGMMSPWAWQHHRLRKWCAGQWVHPGALARAAGWHATSTAEADDIRGLGFTQPICVAPNGVTLPSREDLAAARGHWQRICPAIAEHRVALFYSRFHRKKRVVELIDLWQRHASADWLLLVVGIPEEYSVAELQALAQPASRAGPVRVFSGENAPPPYAAGELFLLPSHSENFGLVIAEAMAAQVPVVVTDTTPWAAVNSHDCGWCGPWSDFADAMKSALQQSTESLQMQGQRAQAWMAAEFSWGQAAATLLRFYAQLQE